MSFIRRLFSRRGQSEPNQNDISAIYEKCIEILGVEIFRRSIDLAAKRYPGEVADPIGAHIKLYCTGEGENERSLKNSTAEQRAIARVVANEIMSLTDPGLYGIPIDTFVETVTRLPETAGSIRRLALCFDQYVAILITCTSVDARNPLRPIIDFQRIRQTAVPLLQWAEEHDPNSSVLETSIAQTFYTLNEVDRGFAAAQRAVDLDEKNPEAWRLLGNGYMAMNDDGSARACFERALQLNPNIGGAREALSVLQGASDDGGREAD